MNNVVMRNEDGTYALNMAAAMVKDDDDDDDDDGGDDDDDDNPQSRQEWREYKERKVAEDSENSLHKDLFIEQFFHGDSVHFIGCI